MEILILLLIIVTILLTANWIILHKAVFFIESGHLYVTYEKIVRGDWGIKETRIFTEKII
jgi:hypothetical protein